MVRSFRRNGREQVRHGSATIEPARRHRFEPAGEARRQSSTTAIASFARAAEQAVGDQPQDCGEVPEKGDSRGYEDRADGSALDGFDRSRGSCDRRVPAPYASAAGRRLPLRIAAFDPAPDALGAASLSSAAWHLAPAGCRRRQTQAAEVQAVSHRLLPHRHRRSADG